MSQSANTAPAPFSNQMRAIDNRFGPIVYRLIETLTSYERALRKHPERQLVKLAASISEFGFVMPVLIEEEGMIIAGEARTRSYAGMTASGARSAKLPARLLGRAGRVQLFFGLKGKRKAA